MSKKISGSLPVVLLMLMGVIGCETAPTDGGGETTLKEEVEQNPPAPGFRAEVSDAEAIAWADAVMAAQGGRNAWDNTRYISWNFFGNRSWVWDKTGQRVRVETADGNFRAVMDLETGEGKVEEAGERVTQPDSLAKRLERVRAMWLNDSYWLVMPFKLKDSGVRLRYLGTDTLKSGIAAQKLELTFEEVGLTPDNKYHLWINPTDSLVMQWAYFRRYDQPEPNFVLPWGDYRRHGEILLAGDRGERDLEEISVAVDTPDSVFEVL